MSSPWSTHEPDAAEPDAQPAAAPLQPAQNPQSVYESLFGRSEQPVEYTAPVEFEAAAEYEPQPIKPDTPYRNAARKIFGPLIAAGAAVIKFGGILLKLKVVTVAGGMIVSVGAYALLGGWWFGVGLVVLILIHELGHYFEFRRQGLPASAPVFIPFVGAYVASSKLPANAWRDAQVSMAGPILGSLGAALIWLAGAHYDSNFLRALAFTGFFLNLVNLIPIWILDGARATALFTPVIWVVGLAALVAVEIARPTPLLPLLIAVGAYNLYRRWRHPDEIESVRDAAVTQGHRVAAAVLYFGLAIVLVFAMHATHVPRDF